MSQAEFTQLIESLSVLSPEQLRRLRHHLDSRLAVAATPGGVGADARDLTADEQADQALQRRLVEAGLLGEVRPPIRDLTPYRHRRAVPIAGEPLSETVIRERR